MRICVYALAYTSEFCYTARGTTHPRKERQIMDSERLALLGSELGEIQRCEQLCPGIYYVCVQPNSDLGQFCSEYYIVLEDAPIPREVMLLGTPLQYIDGLCYELGTGNGSRTAVEYELCKYAIDHGLPVPEGITLHETAMDGMELCPQYFGCFPVPTLTPWGRTLRHKVLENGITWIETDQRMETLALCNPIWSTELSDRAQGYGQQIERHQEDDMAYLFFSRTASSTAIFELLLKRPEWATSGLIRRPELMNAIWEFSPQYVTSHNAQVQEGLFDTAGLMVYAMDGDAELSSEAENMITYSTGIGTDFIGFWK